MSPFAAPLFFRHRRRGKSWPYSWKIYLVCAISIPFGWLIDLISDHNYGKWFFILGAFLYLIGRVVNFFEYNPINGKLEGYFKINEDHFEIQDTVYPFSSISNFEFKVSDYYGETFSDNSLGGPYSQGVGNWISFTESETVHKFYFQFYSFPHIDQFYEEFIKLLYADKLPYNPKYIFVLPEHFGDYRLYKDYIGRLITEKKIHCMTGLDLIGYKNDEEAGDCMPNIAGKSKGVQEKTLNAFIK